MIPYKSTRPEVLFQKNFLILIWIQSHPKGLDHYLHKAVDINEHFAIHHLPEGRSFLAYVFVKKLLRRKEHQQGKMYQEDIWEGGETP